MKVIYTDAVRLQNEWKKELEWSRENEYASRESDFISVHVPLLPEHAGIVELHRNSRNEADGILSQHDSRGRWWMTPR